MMQLEGDEALPAQHQSGCHQLDAVLDLTASKPLHERLGVLLATGRVVLDASAVERVSTPCVQVLLAAGLAAEAGATPFSIVTASDGFSSAIAQLGLQTHFSRWMA